MKFLYFLEKIRNPVCDFFFATVTHIGEETLFLAIALLFFWCVSKRRGYYLLTTGLVGTAINQGLKLIFRIPRPWILDPSFKPIESAIPEATGYSFPSGHTQNVAGTFGSIARSSKRRSVIITSIVIIVLVAFSRMYLGVHTPLDVSVSLIIGAVLVFGLYPVFSSEERMDKCMPFVILGSAVLSLALILFVFLLPEEGIDAANLASGRKNASTLLACFLGLPIIYYVDKKYTNFETDARWYSQVFKFVLGLLGVLAIKAGLKSPLLFIFKNEYIARGVRYFLIVVFAGVVWPLTFKFFKNLKINFLERFGEKFAGVFKKEKKASED